MLRLNKVLKANKSYYIPDLWEACAGPGRTRANAYGPIRQFNEMHWGTPGGYCPYPCHGTHAETTPAKKLPPIRNLTELSERLDRRGAADENLREWCKTVLKRYNPGTAKDRGFHLPVLNPRKSLEGVIDLEDITFPCPLMSMNVKLPLKPALTKDPTKTAQKKKKSNIRESKMNFEMLIKKGKRYDLWSRDFSSLYTASKIPSYKSPV